jgi:CRISPR-associated protein Csd2
MPAEISITRMAVTNEKDVDKERTIGRKFIVPYGLYRAEGFISAPLAEKTGFSEEDLQLLWESLINMFEHDHSAARGKMSSRKLFVFKHASRMGNMPAHKLFDCIKAEKKVEGPARAFADYAITVENEDIEALKAKGVTMEEML